MPQIAQQDYLVIEIIGRVEDATPETKKKLAYCVHAGTILDVVLKSTTNGVCRVVGYTNENGTIAVKYIRSSHNNIGSLVVEPLPE